MTPRWVKAATAAMAIAAVPVAAITPVDHPAQMLAHMAGKDLVLSSPQASDLLRMFFAPQPKNDMPCVQGDEIPVSADMICNYNSPVIAEPELLFAIAGKGDDARITSVAWTYPLPGELWRCRKQGSWHVCFPTAADHRSDAAILREWQGIFRLIASAP